MKAYKKATIEVLELEEDIVRTSGVSGGGGEDSVDDAPLNQYDDIISDFGSSD